ncbi:unnamed protein product [Calypogeia fissa]
MTSTESEPLLKSGDRRELDQNEEWSQGKVKQWAQWAQYVVQPAGDGPVEVNPSEIRDAASQDPYPQWIYGALVTPANDGRAHPDGGPPISQAVVASLSPDILSSVQGLHEDEIRELIVDHVDHQCCWGRWPASKWNIKKVEDCNAFIGALESFIEEREVQSHVEPYSGQPYTTEEQGRPLGPWEVDMRDDFPLLFILKKEARNIIPFSQSVDVCKTCSGKKEVSCPACKSGPVGSLQVAGCSVCRGRGLIAHLDGSDTECGRCKGTGMQDCKQCSSRGSMKCNTCAGNGSLLFSQIVIVRWRTLINKIISASSHAATVPDDVLHEASGIQLYCDQSHTCQPVQFPASYGLTKLSSDLFLTREAVPPTARLIVERHQLRLLPVARVVMSEGDRSFKFYVIGLDKEIYIKNYPATCTLCCCLQMCSVQ